MPRLRTDGHDFPCFHLYLVPEVGEFEFVWELRSGICKLVDDLGIDVFFQRREIPGLDFFKFGDCLHDSRGQFG